MAENEAGIATPGGIFISFPPPGFGVAGIIYIPIIPPFPLLPVALIGR